MNFFRPFKSKKKELLQEIKNICNSPLYAMKISNIDKVYQKFRLEYEKHYNEFGFNQEQTIDEEVLLQKIYIILIELLSTEREIVREYTNMHILFLTAQFIGGDDYIFSSILIRLVSTFSITLLVGKYLNSFTGIILWVFSYLFIINIGFRINLSSIKSRLKDSYHQMILIDDIYANIDYRQKELPYISTAEYYYDNYDIKQFLVAENIEKTERNQFKFGIKERNQENENYGGRYNNIDHHM